MKAVYATAVGALAVAVAGCGRADDKKDDRMDEKDYAKAIIGKWVMAEAGGHMPPGSTVEFTKEGRLAVVVKDDGQEWKVEGTYEVKKDKLTVHLKRGDQEFGETSTISKLPADTLETIDKDGVVEVLKRVKEKDKKD